MNGHLRSHCAVAVLVAPLILAACTPAGGDESADPTSSGSNDTSADPSPSVSPSSPPSPVPSSAPPTAGATLWEQVSALPSGPASGDVLVEVDGLGQVDTDVEGACTRAGDTLVMDLDAGSTTFTVTFRPNSADLVMDDDGVQVTARLGIGAADVTEDELQMDAPLVTSDSATGNATMSIRCGS